MEESLGQLEDKQMEVMMRLNNLSVGVEALRNKTEQNRQMAEDARALANNATRQASSLEQVRTVMDGKFKIQKIYCGLYKDLFDSK